MTTPPKARRFRVRRQAAAAAAANVQKVPRAPAADVAYEDLPFAPDPDAGFGEGSYLPDPPAAGAAPSPELAEALAAIRAEGLSGRQFRTARRVAQKNGINAADDAEAVLLLRRKGIDPFSIAAPALGVVSAGEVHLPQTVRASQSLPAQPTYGEAQRAQEIIRIQQDIVRRRRRNFLMLLARLSVFVFLPTIVAGIYYFFIATPMYATRSEFVIQQADSQAGGLGSLFRGTQFATSQDSITVQAYLQSRDALLRLDRDHAFKTVFSAPEIDEVQRLDPNATNEEAYRLYRRMVKIGYDPTEGIVKMEVIAPAPERSEAFSKALLGYAEEQVDDLTQRLREDQMKGARDSFADAERKVTIAQTTILDLQERLGILDPRTESTAAMSQINAFEIELQKKKLELRQLEDNAQPNAARVAGVKGDIARLEQAIAALRRPLTESADGNSSLAQVTGQLRVAEAELETRQLMLAQAMQQLETARIEANRQVRYLSLGVNPVAPDEATYPRAFENTLLALLIFGGIYLMLSLTAAILREQVTA
ncbi:MAG: capsule biosynthesis protein [Proteobacteria bacterium]|nr:capsule biosynthesis protein [Pseudomonadota bacterium]